MSYVVGFNPTSASDTLADHQFSLGVLGQTSDGKIFESVRANGALAVGDVVGIDESGDATPLTTTTSAPAAGQGLPLGVAMAVLTDNQYGWVQRLGVVAAINVATSCAVHTELNSTASGGRVDDDATVGAEVVAGLTTTAAESSNLAAGILNWPYVGRTL